MSTIRFFGVVAAIFQFLVGLSTASAVEGRRVVFKDHPVRLTMEVGKHFEMDLLSLLQEQGSGHPTWKVGSGAPTWLSLDQARQRLVADPAAGDIGTFKFPFVVAEGESSDINELQLTVIGPPSWKQQRIDLGIQHEDAPFQFTLATLVNNPNAVALSFAATNLPNWLSLSSDGNLTGTPRRNNVGSYSNIIFTVSGGGGSSQMSAFGDVLKTVHPPSWKANPVNLEETLEENQYLRSVSEFVNNPEGTALRFELVTGPNWVRVSPDGQLQGIPTQPDVGGTSVIALFHTNIDGTPYESSTEFKFNVVARNHAPIWIANPVHLPDAHTGIAVLESLCGSAKDQDVGDTLSFQILSGPAWAKLSNQCFLSGTPTKTEVGTSTWKVRVTDGKLSADASIVMNVIKSKEPPHWSVKPVILPNAHEDQPYNEDLNRYVENPDGGPISFSLLDGPSWAQVGANGSIMGTPHAGEVGISKWHVRVTDNQSGADVADVLVQVEHTNHTPEWLIQPVILSTNEDSPTNVSVAAWVRDSDPGDAVKFTLISGPSWAQINAEGTFSGTPKLENEGENNFIVRAMDTAGATSDGKVTIQVKHVNHSPYWTQNPISLANAKEKETYRAIVSDYGKDVDPGEILTFTKVSGPAWVNVSSTGIVSGTPVRSDVGTSSVQIRVMDQATESAVTTATIVVERVPVPPHWRENPVKMTAALEDTAYRFDLSPYVVGDDGVTLTFKKTAGPDWLIVAADGKVSGTPTKKDLGNFKASFEVADAYFKVGADGVGLVQHKNHPPVVHSEALSFTIKERSESSINLNDVKFVEDSDGDKLSYTLENPASWATLTSEGSFKLAPKHTELGNHDFRLRVTDGQLYATGVVKLTVVRDPRPPVWTGTPIKFEARTNELFKANIARYAQDPDGYPISFSKKTGPDWLVIDSLGNLSGIPKDPNMGENQFLITASNDKLGAEGVLLITVKPGTFIDSIAVDKPVSGAPVDNVWVLDHSCASLSLIDRLKNNVHHYYEALSENQIHHNGVILTGDPAHSKFGKGLPVFDKDMLLRWGQADVAGDFVQRTDWAFSDTCYNSPIWSNFRFTERLPTLTDIYHKDYVLPEVPTEILIVTVQRDHTKAYSKNTPQQKWQAAEYADNLVQFYTKENKAVRFNAIAPACPQLSTVNGELASPNNTYRVMVDKTGGKYYPLACEFSMEAVLKEYAEDVSFRANVFAKHELKLTKKPIDLKTIKVMIGETVLVGNTGAATDLWTYDAKANAVHFYWNRMDVSKIKPGESIQVEYRIS